MNGCTVKMLRKVLITHANELMHVQSWILIHMQYNPPAKDFLSSLATSQTQTVYLSTSESSLTVSEYK